MTRQTCALIFRGGDDKSLWHGRAHSSERNKGTKTRFFVIMEHQRDSALPLVVQNLLQKMQKIAWLSWKGIVCIFSDTCRLIHPWLQFGANSQRIVSWWVKRQTDLRLHVWSTCSSVDILFTLYKKKFDNMFFALYIIETVTYSVITMCCHFVFRREMPTW